MEESVQEASHIITTPEGDEEEFHKKVGEHLETAGFDGQKQSIAPVTERTPVSSIISENIHGGLEAVGVASGDVQRFVVGGTPVRTTESSGPLKWLKERFKKEASLKKGELVEK